MEIIYKLLSEDPFLLFVAGGCLLLVALLLALFTHYRRYQKQNRVRVVRVDHKKKKASEEESEEEDAEEETPETEEEGRRNYLPFPVQPLDLSDRVISSASSTSIQSDKLAENILTQFKESQTSLKPEIQIDSTPPSEVLEESSIEAIQESSNDSVSPNHVSDSLLEPQAEAESKQDADSEPVKQDAEDEADEIPASKDDQVKQMLADLPKTPLNGDMLLRVVRGQSKLKEEGTDAFSSVEAEIGGKSKGGLFDRIRDTIMGRPKVSELELEDEPIELSDFKLSTDPELPSSQPSASLETIFPKNGDELLEQLRFEEHSPESVSQLVAEWPEESVEKVSNVSADPLSTEGLESLHIKAVIQESAEIMHSAESASNKGQSEQEKVSSSLIFPPLNDSVLGRKPLAPETVEGYDESVIKQEGVVDAEEGSATLTKRALSFLPFGRFRKTYTPVEPDSTLASIGDSPPPVEVDASDSSLASIEDTPPSVAESVIQPVSNQIVRYPESASQVKQTQLTVSKPSVSQLTPTSSDRVTAFYQETDWKTLLPKLESEASKGISQVKGKTGQALPSIQQGLIQPVQSMFSSQEHAEHLWKALSSQDYDEASENLNEIIEEQMHVYKAWRRQFGKFARLFSIVAMNENQESAYKSMKKAVTLDPEDAWNWYALALITLQLGNEAEYHSLLEKTLSVCVADDHQLPLSESIQRSPRKEAEEVYVKVLEELASDHIQSGNVEKSLQYLKTAMTYFHQSLTTMTDSPQLGNMAEHHISIALRLAKAEETLSHTDRAVLILQESLELSYCQGLPRFKVLLALIELRKNIDFSVKVLEGYFNDATALILSFPQNHQEGSRYYRVLADYHLEKGSFAQAEPLLKFALSVDSEYKNLEGEAYDSHGLAKVAKGSKKSTVAYEYWRRTQEIVDQIEDTNIFDKLFRVEVGLGLAECLLEKQETDRAVPLLEKSLPLVATLPISSLLGKRFLALGNLLMQQDQFALAESYLKCAQKSFEQSNEVLDKRETLLSLAQCQNLLSKWNDSERTLHLASALLEEKSDLWFSVHVKKLLGEVAEAKQNPAKALEYGSSAINELNPELSNGKLSQEQSSKWAFVLKTLYTIMGRAYYQMGHQNAVKMFNNALYYANVNDEDRLDLELALSNALLDSGDAAKALEILESCIQVASRKGDQALQSDISIQMARGLIRIGTFDRAESMLRQVHDQARNAGDILATAKVASAFGEYYLAQEKVDTALSFYQQSASAYETSGQVFQSAIQKREWADVLLKHQRVSEAEPLLVEAAEVFSQTGANRLCAETLSSLSKIELKQNRSEVAEQHYQKAVDLWEGLDDLDRTASEYASLGILKMRRGKHDEAKQDWLKAKAMFEKLEKQESVAQITGWLDMMGESA